MSTSRRHKQVVNIEEVPPVESSQGTRYRSRRRPLGQATGGKGLGCSHYELPPGSSSFPFHFHCANDEAIYVLSGTGTLRLGSESVEVGPGDFVSLPAGPEMPHQLRSGPDSPLAFLAFSTMVPTDVMVYPDSGKIGVFAGAAPGGVKAQRFVDGFFRQSSAVGYYDGEDVD